MIVSVPSIITWNAVDYRYHLIIRGVVECSANQRPRSCRVRVNLQPDIISISVNLASSRYARGDGPKKRGPSFITANNMMEACYTKRDRRRPLLGHNDNKVARKYSATHAFRLSGAVVQQKLPRERSGMAGHSGTVELGET